MGRNARGKRYASRRGECILQRKTFLVRGELGGEEKKVISLKTKRKVW